MLVRMSPVERRSPALFNLAAQARKAAARPPTRQKNRKSGGSKLHGDSSHEAYTAIAWGVGFSHERLDVAGAEGFHSPEGNMCGTVMRGADALPGSKATSRAKGSHRKLGDLGSDRNGIAVAGPHREGEEP
jgi:hypothetical protein